MRDRLIELIKQTVHPYFAEEIADNLLANGVIVQPCKVGGAVYFLQNNRIAYGIVSNLIINETNKCFEVWEIDEHNEIAQEWTIPSCEFGKTVFLTKEEAEEALKGGAE